jgi:hypothetical protein
MGPHNSRERPHCAGSDTGPRFKVQLKKPGKYRVTLTITDSYGFTGTTTIKVKAKKPRHHTHHSQGAAAVTRRP